MANNSTVSPLRQRMIEDMVARKLNPHTQRSHIHSCKRFAAYLKRWPDTATPDDVRAFQLHLIESGASICNRNRIMTGVRFLFRVTLRRHDLAAEVYHIKEPQKEPEQPCVLPQTRTRRFPASGSSRERFARDSVVAMDDPCRTMTNYAFEHRPQGTSRNFGQDFKRRTGPFCITNPSGG